MAKFLNVIQGSSAWLEARMGKPTASECDKIITPGGMPSKSASAYANRLLCELMLGRPLQGILTGPMQRGKTLEAEACLYYDLVRDTETTPIGLVVSDDGRLAASPDRLCGDKGLVEVKCPLDEAASRYLSAHIDALLGGDGIGGVADTYKCQIQMQLFVCEREWVDVISYYPGLPSCITRIERDEPFIVKMRALLYDFVAMLDEREEKLRTLGYITEPPKLAEEPVTAFGLTEADVEDYISAMKEKGVWAETPAGDAAVSGGAAASEAATDPSGEGKSPQASLFLKSEPVAAGHSEPNDAPGRRGRR